MNNIINRILRAFGDRMLRIGYAQDYIRCDNTMTSGLIRMNKLGINPNTIIDLGAAQGLWTLGTMPIWPEAQYILFEPLNERKRELELLKTKYKNIHLVHAAAGEKRTFAHMQITEDLDSSVIAEFEIPGKTRKIETTTVDEEVAKFSLPPPYVIKFDTHGFEIPILEGAKSTLSLASLLVMECYGFHITKKSLLLHEMCLHLQNSGFLLADIVDIERRPYDNLFWQCDVFFLPSNHSSFEYNSYIK